VEGGGFEEAGWFRRVAGFEEGLELDNVTLLMNIIFSLLCD